MDIYLYVISKPLTLQFSIGNKRPTKGDSTDISAKVGHNLGEIGRCIHCKMWIFYNVLSHASKYCRQTHQTVESSDQLRQVRDLDALRNCQAYWKTKVRETLNLTDLWKTGVCITVANEHCLLPRMD